MGGNNMSCKEEYKNLEDKLNSRYRLLNREEIAPDEYVIMRFEQSVKWYIKKANKFKYFFYLFSIIGIVFPASIPIVNSFLRSNHCESDFVITIISVSASISASFLTLFKAQEKWIHYRYVAETLQTEYSFYTTAVGEYEDSEKRLKRFLKKIESIMSDEHDQWLKMFDEKDKS